MNGIKFIHVLILFKLMKDLNIDRITQNILLLSGKNILLFKYKIHKFWTYFGILIHSTIFILY